MQKTISGAMFRKMILVASKLLEENRQYVDSLNVFPVPDGDTGTNMNLTFKSALKEVNECVNNNFDSLSEAITKGALRGARGNSGVILSQILKGMATVFRQCTELKTKDFARAIKEGADIAYKAVTKPKEGTILTVVRVMSEYAQSSCKKYSDFETFLKDVLDKGEEILLQTPELLPVLKKAGVVDAGGRGLLVIFTGFYKALTNDDALTEEAIDPVSAYEKDKSIHSNIVDLAEIQFAYCTEYMIINMHKKTTQSDIDKLRERLVELGDSVICIGDLSLVKVHVHSNEPNKALGFALELGEITNVKIENMLEQNRELLKEKNKKELSKPMGIVSVAAGDGFSVLFKDLMVDYIIKGGQTMNPSANDIVEAVDKVNADTVFVLPNNKNIILAAEQAKDLTKKNIVVIPTKSIPEGISSCLAFNPDATVEENTEAMMESMQNVKTGSVTYAVRDTHVDGFDLSVGEIIGLDNSSILAKGKEVTETVQGLVDKLLDDNTVNVTLFYGTDIKEEDALKLQEKLQNIYPQCEFNAVCGGQPVYYYILSVE
ncbi:MAG: DAK2 domain-containing protein [Clostridia bacterium]|nr:DAK2 domain-containing protein [Clostridia bacterium]